MKTKMAVPATLIAFWSAAGCTESMAPDTATETGAATTTENGMAEINGLSSYNGLNSNNGLNTYNGLNSFNGLMSTFPGRITTSYLVKCALPAGRSIKKQDQYNAWYTYQGAVGVGPGWEAGACDAACQQAISACMMAHVNTAGVHIPLWLDSPATSIGWGQSATYPNQEGTFFGNIFAPAASGKVEAFYCNGPAWDRSVVPGRLGAYQKNAPYTNPFGADAKCAANCTAASSPNQNDGFASCKGYNTPVTVWRQNPPAFDPNTPYKICSVNSGKCLDIWLGGRNNGEQAVQWTFVNGNNQKWYITKTSGGYYKVINKNSGKALDIWMGEQQDGARIVQWDYVGGENQQWAINPVGNGGFSIVGRHSSKALGVENTSKADGAEVHQWYYFGRANQTWTITPAY